MPSDTLKVAMALYEPSAFKGKLLKKALPWVKNALFLLKYFHIHENRISIDSEFDSLVKELFPGEKIEYAFFLGTPGKHQKITIQLYNNQKILGYCKISSKKDIVDSFYKESDFLTELNKRGITNIPIPLFCGQYKEYGVFIQSTSKLISSYTRHTLDKEHLRFISVFNEKTSLDMEFTSTEYHSMLQEYKTLLKGKTDQASSVLVNAIKIIESELVAVKRFSFYHGDFTPWNIYYNNSDSMYVFDFEYAKHSYPLYIDLFHFFTQSELYRCNISVEKIFKRFKQKFYSKTYYEILKYPEVYYMMYLIDIIYFYESRDKKQMDEETVRLQLIRKELVRLCCRLYTDNKNAINI